MSASTHNNIIIKHLYCVDVMRISSQVQNKKKSDNILANVDVYKRQMCSIITGLSGGAATLGNTLKKLKENGVNIHPALENAFKQLYGYTSESVGIRHGSIEFVNVASEEAKYMLVSCSAFVNYLTEKWIKYNLK